VRFDVYMEPVAWLHQCVEYDVSFHFHQTGYNFRRGGRVYHIPRKEQHTQAAKANVDYRAVRVSPTDNV